MSCNSCVILADIETNMLLPFSKFIKAEIRFGANLRGEKKNPRRATYLFYNLHFLFLPGSVIICNDKVLMKQNTFY